MLWGPIFFGAEPKSRGANVELNPCSFEGKLHLFESFHCGMLFLEWGPRQDHIFPLLLLLMHLFDLLLWRPVHRAFRCFSEENYSISSSKFVKSMGQDEFRVFPYHHCELSFSVWETFYCCITIHHNLAMCWVLITSKTSESNFPWCG